MTTKEESDGGCNDCASPESRTDEHCMQHSGNTTKINSLLERVGEVEQRESEVDRLIGKVNLLISLNCALLLFITGELGYSVIANNAATEKYNKDRISVVTTIHGIEKRFTEVMGTISKTFDARMDKFEKQLIINNERLNHIEENKPNKNGN